MSETKQRRADGEPLAASRDWVCSQQGKFTRNDMVRAGIVCASNEAGRVIEKLKKEGVAITSAKTAQGGLVYQVIRQKVGLSWDSVFAAMNSASNRAQ